MKNLWLYFIPGILFSIFLIVMMDTEGWKKEILKDPDMGSEVFETSSLIFLICNVILFWPYYLGSAIKEWIEYKREA